MYIEWANSVLIMVNSLLNSKIISSFCVTQVVRKDPEFFNILKVLFKILEI